MSKFRDAVAAERDRREAAGIICKCAGSCFDCRAIALLEPRSADELVRRAVRNARGSSPRWVHVRDTFAVGSTRAHELCRAHGVDPDEVCAPQDDEEDEEDS